MPRDWTTDQIKQAIWNSGSSLGELARKAGFHDNVGRAALRRPSPRMEAIIAMQIGKPAHLIWPSRYDSTGIPLRDRRRQNRAASPSPHRQIGAEA